jgi:HAD superfamily hydrolase (TIGR01549 family)
MPERPVLIFDMDGTLVHTTPRMIDEFNYLARKLSTEPILPENIREVDRWNHYYWMPSQEFLDDMKVSDGKRDRSFWLCYARKHLNILGLTASETERVAQPLIDHLLIFLQTAQRTEVFFEDAAATVERLHCSGYRLGLLTNRSEDMFPPVALNELRRYFETVVSAGEVRYWKPDPRIFQVMLSRLNVKAESAYYIGDNYYSDVFGARAAGMHPILIDRNGLFPEATCTVIKRLSDLKGIFPD